MAIIKDQQAPQLAQLATDVLPPDSPDFNPIERIWLTIKARWFNNHICKNEEKLLERLDQVILDVIDNQDPTIHRYRYVIMTNALADTD